MLLFQGAAAFKLYTGKEMPVQEVKKNISPINYCVNRLGNTLKLFTSI